MGIQDRDYYNPDRYNRDTITEKNIASKFKRKNIRLNFKHKFIIFLVLFLLSLSLEYQYISIIQIVLAVLCLFYFYKFLNWNYYGKMQRIKRKFKKPLNTVITILGVLLLLNYTSYMGYHDINTDSMIDFIETQILSFDISTDSYSPITIDSKMNIGDSGISNKDIEISVDYYSLDDEIKYSSEYFGNEGYLKSPDGATFLMIHLTAENIGDTISDKNTIIVNPHTVAIWEYGNEVKGENVDILGVFVKATESYPTNPDSPYLIYKGNKIGIEETSALAVNDCVTEKFYYNSYTIDKYSPVFDDFGATYPNVVKQGWMMFIVPANIDLSQTTLNIENLEWKFTYEENNQNQKVKELLE